LRIKRHVPALLFGGLIISGTGLSFIGLAEIAPLNLHDVVIVSRLDSSLMIVYLVGFAVWCGSLRFMSAHLGSKLPVTGVIARRLPVIAKIGMSSMIGAVGFALLFIAAMSGSLINLTSLLGGFEALQFNNSTVSVDNALKAGGFWLGVTCIVPVLGRLLRADPYCCFQVGSTVFLTSMNWNGKSWKLHYDPNRRQKSDRSTLRADLLKLIDTMETLGPGKPVRIEMESHLFVAEDGQRKREQLLKWFSEKLGYECEYDGEPRKLNWIQRKFRSRRYPKLAPSQIKWTQRVLMTRRINYV